MIPVGATIEKAVLSIYSYSNYSLSVTNRKKELYEITSGWNESDITWSNKPTSSNMILESSNVSSINVWEDFDITHVIKNVIENNDICHGFYITFPSSSYGVEMRSSEYTETEYRPKLTVECELPNSIHNTVLSHLAYDLTFYNSCIQYSIPDNGNNVHVSMKLYDIQGKLIRTLVENRQKSGSYSITINNANHSLAKGIYLCKLQVDGFQKTIRVANK